MSSLVVEKEAAAGNPVHQPLSGALVNEPHRKLRVCVLHASLEGSCSTFKDVDPHAKPEAYDPHGRYEWSAAFLRKATSAAQLLELVPGVTEQGGDSAKAAPDVFLNLCDGGWDEDRAGKEVVEALERLNLPYTGANAAFYEPSKIEMKMAAHYYGVKVPAWVHIQCGVGRRGVEAGLEAVLAPPSRGGLRFPLIVKHPSGYGSVGMTKDSKVHDEVQLRKQVALFVGSFGGALVEEFITGREFTVLVVEEPGAASDAGRDTDPDLTSFCPVAYTPVECAFGPGEDFKHFNLKWEDYESLSWRPCAEPELAERLKAAACDTFRATRGVSYGRCDFRVDAAGDIYLLEINPNCGVLYPPGLHGSADYILSLDPEHDHAHFLSTIFATAITRHSLRQPKVAPVFFRRPPRPVPEQHQHQPHVPEDDAPRTPTCEAAAASAAAAATAVAAALSLEDHTDGVATATASSGSDSGTNSSTASGASSPSRISKASGASGAAAANGATGVGGKSSQAAVAGSDAAEGGAGAGGWGLVALVPIRAGEVVQRNEQRPAVLASSGFVQRSWPVGSRQRNWFEAYAYPIGEEVFVTWSDDPTTWAPLNHSCDPNCWLRGLDLVARRNIAPGEQITADYATFCAGPDVAAFECDCGASCCRRRVTGGDYLQPWVVERYGQHVSPFVAAARRRAGLA
ncbi:hypothetical protein HYH02_015082 [Chlamydomonas schloesseri]|uniref:ATP-grasp domain-containing protein n=1 Tax=Chlamydomonas schloesseri TaxID=2026947 RepID=A0A835SSD5_9CHLO|nr:hypothetical protein HYH02_015082 [Chlamydomonas schloesseri]|eukprot:KAG2425031.1 hypothetical protein HYH02_015082 [Chlamydomonas schloesseri]